jgi:hypothetical protein
MHTSQSGDATRNGRKRHRYGQTIAAGAITVLFVSCGRPQLPVGPSELTSGIVIYEHADYAGASAHITEDIGHLKDFEGPCQRLESDGGFTTTVDVWDDCISSVRVAPGWQAILYRDDDFDGDRLRVTQDTANLTLAPGSCDKGGFNDCVTSIHLVSPR